VNLPLSTPGTAKLPTPTSASEVRTHASPACLKQCGPQGCERVKNIVVRCISGLYGLPDILSYTAKSLLDKLEAIPKQECFEKSAGAMATLCTC
jgi:hypothetical protein